MTPAILVTLAALVVLVVADSRHALRLKALAKTAASTGFLAVAITSGASSSPFGDALLAALAFSWLGDVALLGQSDVAFRAGVGLFLVGHLGFDAAFLVRGVTGGGVLVGALVVTPVALVVYRWLASSVHGAMWIAVRSYLLVISSMVSLAIATVWAGGPPLFLLAAVLFFVSDLLVARERFVSPSPLNSMVGLPLYYVAQVCFASSPVWASIR